MDEEENPFRPGSTVSFYQALLGLEVLLITLGNFPLGVFSFCIYMVGMLWIQKMYKSLE